ncbi:MAG TPA: hypothetical protein VHX66_04205 [Solirubrobacteraceae bacterium]|nr:hypothetical protein [Solirubrobacteraceae bacterium]
MTRRRKRLWIAVGVVLFLVISFELARWLTLENLERTKIVSLLTAEARGKASVMLSDLHGCDAGCRADVRKDARTLKRPGAVLILADQSATAYALTSRTGMTRIAWKSTRRLLPVVQCVTVQRKGNVVSGLSLTLLAVSLPLHPTTADC